MSSQQLSSNATTTQVHNTESNFLNILSLNTLMNSFSSITSSIQQEYHTVVAPYRHFISEEITSTKTIKTYQRRLSIDGSLFTWSTTRPRGNTIPIGDTPAAVLLRTAMVAHMCVEQNPSLREGLKMFTGRVEIEDAAATQADHSEEAERARSATYRALEARRRHQLDLITDRYVAIVETAISEAVQRQQHITEHEENAELQDTRCTTYRALEARQRDQLDQITNRHVAIIEKAIDKEVQQRANEAHDNVGAEGGRCANYRVLQDLRRYRSEETTSKHVAIAENAINQEAQQRERDADITGNVTILEAQMEGKVEKRMDWRIGDVESATVEAQRIKDGAQEERKIGDGTTLLVVTAPVIEVKKSRWDMFKRRSEKKKRDMAMEPYLQGCTSTKSEESVESLEKVDGERKTKRSWRGLWMGVLCTAHIEE